MKTKLKHIILGTALLLTASVSAHTPSIDDGSVKEVKTIINKAKKVNAKEVEEVFMKVKRVDRIFTPKKKLYKKKYTIA